MGATGRVDDEHGRADAELGSHRPRGTSVALIVVDASVALHLAAGDLFARVTDDLVAPALLWSEVAAAVRRAISTGRVTPHLGRVTLERALTSDIRRRASDELYRRAVAIADDLGWSKSYDAEYLALAELERAPLVTLDARLRRGAHSRVEVVELGDVLR